MKYLLLLTLIACGQNPEVSQMEKLTLNQKEFLAQASLEARAYFDSCLSKSYKDFEYCFERFKSFGVTEKHYKGSSVLKTAAGTALGYGAAKMIIGK